MLTVPLRKSIAEIIVNAISEIERFNSFKITNP